MWSPTYLLWWWLSHLFPLLVLQLLQTLQAYIKSTFPNSIEIWWSMNTQSLLLTPQVSVMISFLVRLLKKSAFILIMIMILFLFCWMEYIPLCNTLEFFHKATFLPCLHRSIFLVKMTALVMLSLALSWHTSMMPIMKRPTSTMLHLIYTISCWIREKTLSMSYSLNTKPLLEMQFDVSFLKRMSHHRNSIIMHRCA